MYRYILMPAAIKDIQKIADYIAFELHAPESADALLDAIDEALDHACRFPYALPLLTDTFFASCQIRKVLIKQYIAYVVPDPEKATLNVLRILYYRQDHRTNLP